MFPYFTYVRLRLFLVASSLPRVSLTGVGRTVAPSVAPAAAPAPATGRRRPGSTQITTSHKAAPVRPTHSSWRLSVSVCLPETARSRGRPRSSGGGQKRRQLSGKKAALVAVFTSFCRRQNAARGRVRQPPAPCEASNSNTPAARRPEVTSSHAARTAEEKTDDGRRRSRLAG